MAKKTAPVSVLRGDVFATFVHEAKSLGDEVVARRAFDDDVGAFLKERELLADFEAWRVARRARAPKG